MLRNVFDLTRVFLLSAFRRSTSSKRPWLKVLYVVLSAYLAVVSGFLSYELIDGLKALRQEEAFLGIVMMLVISFALFTTIMGCINVLYFSKDNLFVLPLPLGSREVFAAKVNVLLVYAYVETLFLGLIPLLVYGYMNSQGLIYYLFILPVLILLPVIPLLIASFLVVSLMALTKGIRNKSLVQLITMTLAIIMSLGISLLSSSASSQEDLLVIVNTVNGMSQLYQKVFPTMPMAVAALAKGNVLALLGLLAVSAAAYLLVVAYGDKVYYRGMLGSLFSSEGISSRKLDVKKAYRSEGLLHSYVMKEMKTYLRRPTFFVQLILPGLILPLFMLLIFYVSLSSDRQMIMEVLRDIFADRSNDGYVFAVYVLFNMFGSMYSFLSVTAISKDGRDACAMKYLPIPFYRQLIYKMLPDILLCMLGNAAASIIMALVIGLPVRFVLLGLPLLASYFILHGFLILFDALRPKLHWNSELEVCKNNLLMMATMAFVLFNMALIGVCAFMLKMGFIFMAVFFTALYATVSGLAYLYIREKDLKLAVHIE